MPTYLKNFHPNKTSINKPTILEATFTDEEYIYRYEFKDTIISFCEKIYLIAVLVCNLIIRHLPYFSIQVISLLANLSFGYNNSMNKVVTGTIPT